MLLRMLDKPDHPMGAASDARLRENRLLIEAAQRAFSRAAKAAVAENDRLGITTHGGKDGKVTERHPKPVLKPAIP